MKFPLAIVLGLLAVATASAGEATPSRVYQPGISQIVSDPQKAASILDTCSRNSPGREPGGVTAYWTPSTAQAGALDHEITKLEPGVHLPQSYDRQYVGIVFKGKKLIYINAYEPGGPSNVCDGGPTFWGAVFDPATKTFSNIAFNGEA